MENPKTLKDLESFSEIDKAIGNLIEFAYVDISEYEDEVFRSFFYDVNRLCEKLNDLMS